MAGSCTGSPTRNSCRHAKAGKSGSRTSNVRHRNTGSPTRKSGKHAQACKGSSKVGNTGQRKWNQKQWEARKHQITNQEKLQACAGLQRYKQGRKYGAKKMKSEAQAYVRQCLRSTFQIFLALSYFAGQGHSLRT